VGTSFVVDGTTTPPIIGKSAACTLVLADAQVSRRHTSFDVVDGALRVTDLGSTNGTFVNGARVSEAFLQDSGLVVVGSTVMRVERIATPSSAARPPVVASSGSGFGRIVGASPAMRRLYPLFARLASSDLPVVIEGDTGTGKELLAEMLHESGSRCAGPFVVLDCGAIASAQVEAVLFGDEKSGLRGVFEQAHQGTLLIDEVTELPVELQGKLLRAIEGGEFCRLGSDRWMRVDVRVIATTRRNIEKDVEANRFREDLFFRLAVGRIELPPLRHRLGDDSLLAAHFARKMVGPSSAVPTDFLRRYEGYSWPGNVRELQNALARRLALGDVDPSANATAAEPNAAPEHAFRWLLEQDLPYSTARDLITSELERRYVARVLEQYDGNVSRAAAASGLARRYFQIMRARTVK
jgi:DNA-binding NtrC family response regulator